MEIRHIQDGKIVSINGKPVEVVEEPKKKVSKSKPTPVEEIDHFNNVDVVEPIQDEEPT
jgi:hypothetical protein